MLVFRFDRCHTAHHFNLKHLRYIRSSFGMATRDHGKGLVRFDGECFLRLVNVTVCIGLIIDIISKIIYK